MYSLAQVAALQLAVRDERPELILDGALVRLQPSCALFLTATPAFGPNPRAPLPLNMKVCPAASRYSSISQCFFIRY